MVKAVPHLCAGLYPQTWCCTTCLSWLSWARTGQTVFCVGASVVPTY